jgi:hypothetical protein
MLQPRPTHWARASSCHHGSLGHGYRSLLGRPCMRGVIDNEWGQLITEAGAMLWGHLKVGTTTA